LFVFENGVFNVLFQPARCDDVSGVWQEIGARGYWLVNFRHHGALATLFETTTPERRTTSLTLVHRARRATLIRSSLPIDPSSRTPERITVSGFFVCPNTQKGDFKDEMELDVWRSAGSRYRLAEFSADFGVHRNPATGNRL
jgi:hypothetical protein